LQDIFDLKAKCELLAQREGKGADAFGRDGKLPERVFAEQADNCADELHAARWESQLIMVFYSFFLYFENS
jgi:hypothetical protein